MGTTVFLFPDLYNGNVGLLGPSLTARRGTMQLEMSCLVLHLGLRSIVSFAHTSSVYQCTVLSGPESSPCKDPQPFLEILLFSQSKETFAHPYEGAYIHQEHPFKISVTIKMFSHAFFISWFDTSSIHRGYLQYSSSKSPRIIPMLVKIVSHPHAQILIPKSLSL